MAAARMTPILKDGALFLVWMALLVVGVWGAVSYGVSFTDPGRGIAAWAVVLLLVVGGLLTALMALWWYYVYPEEREPARGEWTLDHRHVRAGEGSFRSKAAGPGITEEPAYRMTAEEGFVPRTRARWIAWFGTMAAALVGAALLVGWSRQSEDPLAPLLAGVALLGGAVMLGALAVGEMGHEGPWARRGGAAR
ncbi:MAG TPA: hypothetical protein VGR28_13520 [Candidatus Thermoplasmatota archaeon]|jgi:hypothetical protein|nr:hypothetical protein [Candidatus Thermoplasmatota archaeon]